QKDNLNVKPSKVNKVDSHSTPVSFLALPNVNSNTHENSNTQKDVSETGSITLTIYQTNTDRALANQNVTINGQNYTTNTQGKVKISDLNTGSHTINLTAQGFNPTSTTTNIKSGKNMNKIVYLTADANSVASQANNNSNNSSAASQANNNSNNSSAASQANNNSNNSSAASQANNNSNNSSAASQANNNSNNSSAASQANNNSNNSSAASQTNNESTAQLQQAIVQYAKTFLGRPYIWGATGPNAFDCSGLTYYVYKHFGQYIGRTTYTQIDQGTPVSLNNLEPGDLIFWGDPSAPYHVAIYIGNGQYIQAPKPGETVDISSWNLDNVCAARRIV
ncbi:MAG: NlpC/P60 family protein, partial [Sarcina sp.]